jgi:hypothetical protein
MTLKENFGENDITNKYCAYCTDKKGAFKSFDL